MIGILSGIALILLALTALAMQRLYSSIPARELKRLARSGDHLAKSLYKPVAYGASARLLLWIMVVVALSGGLLLILPHMPPVAGFATLVAISVIALVWIPSLRLTVHTAQFAALLAPSVSWVLARLHGPLTNLANLINKYRALAPHSRLYEKEDLRDLLYLQKQQIDNRIAHEELELMERSLVFGDKVAADIVQPRKEAHLVNADDALGPILLDSLHQSDQASFLVYKDKKENIIGSLSMQDAIKAKQGGRVFDLIRNDLTYVHEDFTLRQVLAAFQKTGQQVGVVINSFEELVGVITLESLLHELIGETPEAEVASYGNRGSVAAYKPKQPEEPEVAETQDETPEEAPTSPEATEVVE